MGTREDAEYEQASPPPYVETEQSESASVPQPNPLYPPQPYHKQAPSRTLQVDFTSVTQRHLRVTEVGSERNVIYSADLHLREPNMVFKSDPVNDNLATVKFPTVGQNIEIHIRGQDITLRVPVKLGMKSYLETKFESQALQNAHLTWKRRGSFMKNFECRDEQSTLIAEFISSTWSLKKVGKMEFYGTHVSNGQAMDELLVTGLAMAYYTNITESSMVAVGV